MPIAEPEICPGELGVGTNDFYAFDMTTESWSSVAPLPASEERQYACGFSNGIYGFIFGGYNAGTYVVCLTNEDSFLVNELVISH